MSFLFDDASSATQGVCFQTQLCMFNFRCACIPNHRHFIKSQSYLTAESFPPNSNLHRHTSTDTHTHTHCPRMLLLVHIHGPSMNRYCRNQETNKVVVSFLCHQVESKAVTYFQSFWIWPLSVAQFGGIYCSCKVSGIHGFINSSSFTPPNTISDNKLYFSKL